jgi:hypothetical protein
LYEAIGAGGKPGATLPQVAQVVSHLALRRWFMDQ